MQDAVSGAVLMLGYMNREALAATQASGRVTFWSRSKRRLWTKGETSGHFLEAQQISGGLRRRHAADPGPAAGSRLPPGHGHLLRRERRRSAAAERLAFLAVLEEVIRARIAERPQGSYTAKLLDEGPRRIAQKVGEEGLELALAALAQSDEEVMGEAADLLYHVLLLLESKGLSLGQVTDRLEARHRSAESRKRD